jgi:hypothetical protein
MADDKMTKYLKFLGNDTIAKAKDDLNLVDIGGVKGVLMEPIKYQLQGDWEPLLTPESLGTGVATIQKAAQITGNLVGQTGLFSERFYIGGSYTTFNISMRIVDWEGTGNVLSNTKLLYAYVVPNTWGDSSAGSLKAEFNAQKQEAGTGAGGKAEAILRTALNSAKNSFASAPKQTYVHLGNYIRMTGMIVINVGATYSLEMTPYGPLYADVEVEVGSKQLTTLDSLGITDKFQQKRVTTQGQ